MTRPFATCDGHPVASVTVYVPAVGVWFADVDFDAAPDVSGRVTIALGDLELVGTVDPTHNGTRGGLHRVARIVGGAGGWSTLVAAKAYHNDSRIRARTIVEDAAREAGETLGDFAPEAERVGVDYVRQTGPASRVLEDVIGGVAWWVAYDGSTHVGERETSEASPGSYEVLELLPGERIATLAVDDLRAVVVGSVLSERLDAPLTVRELEIEVTGATVRVKAYGAEHGGLAGLLRSIVARATDARLWGLWRYRVVRMSSDRVELQAVRRAPGLPDVLPISMWPGVAGAHAELAPGAEVLVSFIEGDRTMPIVAHFAGQDGTGWTPAALTLDASGASASIKLGANATESPAWASKVLEELNKLVTTLGTGTSATGGAVTFGTAYVAPLTAGALGAAKTVCE